jgi:hypothetical protein
VQLLDHDESSLGSSPLGAHLRVPPPWRVTRGAGPRYGSPLTREAPARANVLMGRLRRGRGRSRLMWRLVATIPRLHHQPGHHDLALDRAPRWARLRTPHGVMICRVAIAVLPADGYTPTTGADSSSQRTGLWPPVCASYSRGPRPPLCGVVVSLVAERVFGTW